MPDLIPTNDITKKDVLHETFTLGGDLSQTAAYFSYVITARKGMEIVAILEKHEVAGSDGAAVTLDVKHVPNGSAISAGTSLLAEEFDLKGTADTVVYKEGVALSSARKLSPYDSVGLETTGTLTSLEGVTVTVFYKPVGKGNYQ
ncbi:MAG: hypothetical protein HN402_07825 [Candidatus Scalindua sp.]|jgi:hypothetical protein|nr:hypothetical protein [Candidatus Scalindua sp.]MBT6757764.1 hypothetical protein [Candidatus Jacksonbacteria bacterium]